MTSKTLFGKLALAGCLLIAGTLIGRAQTMSQSATPPVPGIYDVSQLQFHDPASTGQPAGGFPNGFNYYWDANNNNPGKPGSTFTTGSNPGGYILNSVTVRTVANSGGNSFNNAATYSVRIYKVDSATTNATLIVNNAAANYAYAGVGGDWLTMSNLTLPLSPNTTYAYTLGGSVGYMMLMYSNALGSTASDMTMRLVQIPIAGGRMNISTSANMPAGTFDVGLSLPTAMAVAPPTASVANPVNVGTSVTLTAGTVVDNGGNGTYTYQWLTDGGGGGGLTNIPSATGSTYNFNTAGMDPTNFGNYVFAVRVFDSTPQTITSSPLTVNVMLRQIGTIGTTPASVLPTPGADDAYQLDDSGLGNASGSHNQGNLNYYSDNGQNNGGWMGNTFTTGSNPKGYTMGSLAVCLDGQPGPDAPSYGYGGLNTTLNGTYNLYVYKVSADLSTAQVIMQVTNWSAGFVISNYPVWAKSSFVPITLLPNTVYGYGFGRGSVNVGYAQLALSVSDEYAAGSAASFPTVGGGITYINNGLDGVFDVDLTPLGFPFLLNAPVATPSPAYALSPVSLTASAKTAGTYTYRWLTDDGSGSTPPVYIAIAGANSANVTVVPQDQFGDYTTNYYFVATRTTDSISVTSAAVVLTVHAASPPLLTDPTPASLTTFAGARVTYAAGEIGTLPITNQWFANYGGGYVPLTLKTNSTLVLTNVQTADSGSYKMTATNNYGAVGSAVTTPVTLTVLADPAGPNAATQIYFNMVYTNSPWAYWRLNETGNPSASTIMAYDYSGHGFLSTYGGSVSVNNPGPVPSVSPPNFPGFDSGELAAGTTVSTVGSSLTVPSLNLNGRSNVTFMAWINPNGTQAPNAGLLFNHNGPDIACGFGFGNTGGHLGYTWNNNSSATYNWDSGLVPAVNQWNFVAYVITPTNTTVYMGNLNGGTNFYQSSNPVANGAETFAGGTILLGGDATTVNRNFNGLICEAALFTNALTTLQVQQYFQAAVGATSLSPTVPTLAVAPAAATGAGVYSGQNVRMTAANSSGTFPITNKWQSSPDGTTWSDVAGATDNTLLINPQTVGTFHYQLVVGNIAATVTSSPVVVNFNALPSTPPGLWTVNFQTTNNIGPGQSTVSGGLGHYVGRGILGNGTYWNPVPQLFGGFAAGSIGSVSDLQDDGVNHTGIYCFMGSGGAYNSLGANGGGTLTYSSDVGNLLDQIYRTYFSGGGNNSALRFYGVPAGIYNLVLFAGNGVSINGAGNFGSTFVVYDAVNGNQTNSTAQAGPTTDALSIGLNFCIVTNVHVSAGQLNVDVLANTAASASASAVVEGAQLQLVSYDPPTNSVAVTGTFTRATVNTPSTISFNWNQGVLQSTTNLLSPWTSINAQAPGLAGALGATPYTVAFTNGMQFFRVQVHP